VSARSKTWVCGCLLAGIGNSNPGGGGGNGCLFLVSVVFCQIKVSSTGRSPVQRNATECGVSRRGQEALIIGKLWPIRGCCAMGKKGKFNFSGL
jgi:hypothetical protein